VVQTGLPFQQWELAICKCWRLLLAGDTAGAEAANDAALEIGVQIGAVEAMGTYGGILFEIRNEQGRLREIDEMFVQAAIENPAIPVLRTAVIKLHLTMDRRDEALELFESDLANRFTEFPRDVTWTTGMVMNADCAVDLGHHQGAEILESMMRPYRDLVAYNDGDVLGSLSRPLGRLSHLLGDYGTAESDFRSALAVHQRIQSPYWSTCTRLDYADFLLDRAQPGDAAQAKVVATEAYEAARLHGYLAMEERARALLQRLTFWSS
jgi:tetratricopeptide (TPR) repeat protein